MNARKIPNVVEYIAERRWKLRSSGTNTGDNTRVSIKATSVYYEAKIENPRNSLLLWLPTIGELILRRLHDSASGYIVFQSEKYALLLKESNNKAIIRVSDGNNIKLRYYIRRIIYKSSYCINCEACEIECPTGALSVYPDIKIDLKKCIHCMRCIDYHEHGCIVADSLVTTMENINSNAKISRYGTFGIQEGWMDEFLADPKNFWSNNTLGVKQVPSFKAWLKDAELIDDNGLTELGGFCYENRDDLSTLIWEIIYVNLCFNSPLLQWFIRDIPFGTIIERKEMEIMILDYFNGAFARSSILYALQALLQVFKYSPIGAEFKQLEAINAKCPRYRRNTYDDVSEEGVVYAIYKYAQLKGKDMCRFSDFYRQDEFHSIHKIFGISKNELTKKLRSISAAKCRVLTAELNMGLDHITLVDGMTPLKALQIMTR